MALPKLLDDLAIIIDLPDEPNDNDGMSAQELKDCFDRASLIIQAYINDQLTPAADAAIEAAALGITQQGIDTEYIKDNAVTEDKLSQVTGLEAVVTKTIRNNAVTLDKLSSALQELLTTYGTNITSLNSTTNTQGTAISDLAIALNNLAAVVSGKQAQHKTGAATLVSGATSWTVIVAGVKADNTVIVTPDSDSFTEFVDTGIRCTGQDNNTLTFEADSATANDLVVNVLILD